MELQILDLLVSNGGAMPYVDLINSFPAGAETKGFLQLLRRDDYIRGSFEPYSHVTITPMGHAYLSKLRQQEDERSHISSQNRRNNQLAWVQIIIAAVALIFVVLTFFGLEPKAVSDEHPSVPQQQCDTLNNP